MSRPVIHRGSHGPAVLAARKRLADRGHDTPHPLSEFFGQGLERAVFAFQTHEGLHRDGVVGPKTWAALTRKPEHHEWAHGELGQFALLAKQRVTGRDGKPRPEYVFGAETSLRDKYPSRLDCSELVQWAVGQVTGDLWVDGSANQARAVRSISVEKARHTIGALVFLTLDNTPTGTVHHVGVVVEEDGKPAVAQARSAYMTPECGVWGFDSQDWVLAGLVPILLAR